MQVRFWLSFDLGVKGDYLGLYAWLDNHDAVECGDGVASFILECSNRDAAGEELMEAISSNVNLAASDRIYVIYRLDDGTVRGKFMHGKRKANPWEGYGNSGEESEESDES